RIMAFFDGADEPVMDIPDADVLRRRAEHEKKIADAVAALPSKFPLDNGLEWTPVKVTNVTSFNSGAGRILEDGSVLMGGPNPERDRTEVIFSVDMPQVAALRLEVLPDDSLPKNGPGQGKNGTFVVTEISLSDGKPIPFASGTADFEQQNFPASAALDGDPQ